MVKKTRRPHILKIDVEGHDYEVHTHAHIPPHAHNQPIHIQIYIQVLMGFMTEDAPIASLPLIVAFEAKSIAKKFPKVKERMEKL
ncbi:hypothetical protein EON63_16130 [archaeon]|nr:MAG: hypothetical protein EON63_16130 [archaeon]